MEVAIDPGKGCVNLLNLSSVHDVTFRPFALEDTRTRSVRSISALALIWLPLATAHRQLECDQKYKYLIVSNQSPHNWHNKLQMIIFTLFRHGYSGTFGCVKNFLYTFSSSFGHAASAFSQFFVLFFPLSKLR